MPHCSVLMICHVENEPTTCFFYKMNNLVPWEDSPQASMLYEVWVKKRIVNGFKNLTAKPVSKSTDTIKSAMQLSGHVVYIFLSV